jgi:hypothetical protein
MATKEQLYQIIAAFGLGKALPSGSTRAAARLAVRGMIRGGKLFVPTAARIAGTGRMVGSTVARRHPVGAGVLGLLALRELGYLDPLDPIIEPIEEAVDEYVVTPTVSKTRKVKSKFNKAVASGMKGLRMSSHYGKKGTINNAKKAFSAVTKVASKVNKGKKVSTKGVTGTIARAVRKIL